ncbi:MULTISPECIES: adenylate kinase [Chlamydia]|uniref:Adenylate kinase n=3 Tax=Chlamydia TaxID=810 RepID=A0ABP2X2P2_CHLPS|nr:MULTISPECIES: adenylate kinase [Chlamydia]AFS22775.1 adenylate kinase family protein [Chlamydia psittaci VS225]AGE75118.1 adenylate kinase [Chlamydia psittaci Mat116]EPJ24691.1 adenylate kinase family protein [Chlamydia psittaci 09DC77]EPJ31213.1 adenylate kinase family protein [Chlamydia psittaci 06-1683]EPP33394.1 adenylate kinase family protein [Chlamydia psittaci C6/98]
MLNNVFYIIMGPPGSGKGTQSQRLAHLLKLPHISSGELFRSAIESASPLGIKAAEYINQGCLVPDEIVWGMVQEALNQPECRSGCIIDGFPRTLDQAILLNDFFVQSHADYRVIQLDVSNEEIIRRIHSRFICPSCKYVYNQSQGFSECPTCQIKLVRRSDDTLEVIHKRLEGYEKSTAPVVDYYQELGKLTRIPSEASPDDVFQSIEACIKA